MTIEQLLSQFDALKREMDDKVYRHRVKALVAEMTSEQQEYFQLLQKLHQRWK